MTNRSDYILGRSRHERERLMLQGRIMRPYTERYFRAAGIGPGMKVLDVGSGVGDVALPAGDLVGTGGRVVGLDLDALALERARQRTIEQGCSSWVTFQEIRLEHISTPSSVWHRVWQMWGSKYLSGQVLAARHRRCGESMK